VIRKASINDIQRIAEIYENIIAADEKGERRVGWISGIYPSEQSALEAFHNDSLFVSEDGNQIVAAAKIDQNQADVYAEANWQHDAPDSEVMVLHTLAVDPNMSGRGYGKGFVKFYEDYAAANGCKYLRMDTNATNSSARSLYKKLGYAEVGIVKCNFCGIPNINLVCLEKKLRLL